MSKRSKLGKYCYDPLSKILINKIKKAYTRGENGLMSTYFKKLII